ncbi:MAG TPA: NAD(+) synthase [Clostridiales bacterium UBA9856]|nr:NAD(+) synthase [Clostridiales bacterium UBA9856]
MGKGEVPMTKLGMIRVAAVSPELRIGNTDFNSDEILRYAEEAYDKGAGIIVFPSLCLTGATCGDLFFQDILYENQMAALNKIALSTKKMTAVLVIGFYLRLDNRLFQCAALLQNGLIKGIVPDYFPSGAKGSGNSRWFSPGEEAENLRKSVTLFGCEIPFGKLVFRDPETGIAIGIEVNEDLNSPVSPGAKLCLAGAHILCNPAASPELVGSSRHRRYSVLQKSRDCLCGYIYASAGVWESSSTGVYSGHCLVAERGVLLREDSGLTFHAKIAITDVDYERLVSERAGASGFCAAPASSATYPAPVQTADKSASFQYQQVDLRVLPLLKSDASLMRTYSKTPFLPADEETLWSNCREAFEIQSFALARRLAHTGSKKAVLGISGGIDSTLALLVAAKAMKLLNKQPSDIITVSMPGFGTTDKTHSNAMAMMEAIGTDIREIPIKEAVLLHFKDISHDPEIKDTVYENTQARERTQILMDIANMEGGIHIGTGDLSEGALGWSTYNGDHMSMYNVNAGVPKTFIRAMIRWFIQRVLTGPDQDPAFCSDNQKLAAALQDVLETPVSPELLPPDEKGRIAQKTEDKVGPYVLHDFFLYHTVRWGTSPSKLQAIAKAAFADEYDEEYIRHWLQVFYRRFFAHQFKRSCAPDGPKVGTVSLSAQGDWQMPSDADVSVWLKEL